MIQESYKKVKSLFSKEKSFTAFGPSIWQKSSAQVKCSKLGRFDRLAFEVDLEGQMKF